MAKYYVVAPMVVVKTKDKDEGKRYLYRNAVIEDADEDDAKRLVDEGFLSKSEPEPVDLETQARLAGAVPGVREPGAATGEPEAEQPAPKSRGK